MGDVPENGCLSIVSPLSASITITIEDYNDNAPEFLPDTSYTLRISEGLELQSEVLRFETRDRDKNQLISYKMDKDQNNNFVVTENTGRLFDDILMVVSERNTRKNIYLMYSL